MFIAIISSAPVMIGTNLTVFFTFLLRSLFNHWIQFITLEGSLAQSKKITLTLPPTTTILASDCSDPPTFLFGELEAGLP